MTDKEDLNEQMLRAMRPAVDTQWKASGEAMERFWKTQDQALNAMEAFLHNWFRRRHEAARQAIRVVRCVSECRDPMEAATCIQEWMQEGVTRAGEDMREASETLQKLMADAGANGARDARRATRH